MSRSSWPNGFAVALIATQLGAQTATPLKSPRDLCSTFNRPGVASLAGIVREPTGAPIPYATINFDGGYTTTGLADRNGCFVVKSPRNARLTANVRRIGFQPFTKEVDLTGDSTVFLDVRLSSVASQVPGVQVTAPRNDAMERTGFYDRMLARTNGAGDGYFITPEDLERRNEDRVTHLLEGYPSIKVQYDPKTGFGWVVGRGFSAPTAGSTDCQMSIWLDGNHIKGTSLDEIVNPSSIAAIEIYPSPMRTPPQFQTATGDGACGAIVIWTQRPDFTRNSGNWFKENLLTIIVVPVLLFAIIGSFGKHL